MTHFLLSITCLNFFFKTTQILTCVKQTIVQRRLIKFKLRLDQKYFLPIRLPAKNMCVRGETKEVHFQLCNIMSYRHFYKLTLPKFRGVNKVPQDMMVRNQKWAYFPLFTHQHDVIKLFHSFISGFLKPSNQKFLTVLFEIYLKSQACCDHQNTFLQKKNVRKNLL